MSELRSWNTRYLQGDTPWESGEPHPEMQRLFTKYISTDKPILEIGCGLGTNARWLAKRGHRVTAIDIANSAIAKAKRVATLEDLSIHFTPMDFLQDWYKLNKFPVIFDCAVFQVLSPNELRKNFVKKIADICEKEGYWINISCSKDQLDIISTQTGVKAPPAVSMQELVKVVELQFEIIETHRCEFVINRGENKSAKFNAWGSIFKKR